jgi:predicted RNase H-like HicB family nuclease
MYCGRVCPNTGVENQERIERKRNTCYPVFGGENMKRFFTLEYWTDEGWFVGKLKEIPGVFSQGETLDELKENIADAYRMMLEAESEPEHVGAQVLEVGVEV